MTGGSERNGRAEQLDAVGEAPIEEGCEHGRAAFDQKMVYDDQGAMVNPALRDYRIPAFADVPRSELYFADTYDSVGPLGAKAQGECAINAVAPAIANAVANATGVRFADLPLTPDRIFERLSLDKLSARS